MTLLRPTPEHESYMNIIRNFKNKLQREKKTNTVIEKRTKSIIMEVTTYMITTEIKKYKNRVDQSRRSRCQGPCWT